MSKTIRNRVRKTQTDFWVSNICSHNHGYNYCPICLKKFAMLNSDKYSGAKWDYKRGPLKECLKKKRRARENHVLHNMLKVEDFETNLGFETRFMKGIKWFYD